MSEDRFIELDGKEAKVKTLSGWDSKCDFAIAAVERTDNGQVERITSEAVMGRDRSFGHAIVKGLSIECSFDVTSPGIDYVAPSIGDPVDLAIDSLETAIMYDDTQAGNGKKASNKEK